MVVDGLVANLRDRRLRLRVVLHVTTWADLLAHPEYPAEVTVLDLNLGDGIRIDTKVHALLAAGSQVVLISRHADSTSIARALHAGALSFVPKSAPASELAKAVRAAANGERYLPEEFAPTTLEALQHPKLGPREFRALELYASGHSIREVAEDMGSTVETVKSYIKRARAKYRAAGVELGSKLLLRQHALREGWLDRE